MNRWDVYWADVPFEEDALQGKQIVKEIYVQNKLVNFVAK